MRLDGVSVNVNGGGAVVSCRRDYVVTTLDGLTLKTATTMLMTLSSMAGLDDRRRSPRGRSLRRQTPKLTLLVLLALLVCAARLRAQSTVQSSSPTLAELLKNIYGPNGLVVDSDAVLPDGSTHSAHFNGAFQSEFGRINVALVRQLGALPIPSPASGFTYAFDPSSGTFVRSTQSFGPILADRAETIGRGRFAFGYSLQQFSFETFDGLRLSHIPAVFTHDDFNLGGGRNDFITTQNALSASVSQSTTSLTFGVTDRLDVSVAVPLIRTSLRVVSDATIHRIGTAGNSAIHFFQDPDAPGGFGTERSFIAEGSAAGLGDVTVRAKENVFKTPRGGMALGLELRLPTGQEENPLGSGSLGIKVFDAMSITFGRIAPHLNVAYQRNSASVLAGDVTTERRAIFQTSSRTASGPTSESRNDCRSPST